MTDATLYEPLDIEFALDEKYGEKTVRELGHIPYLAPYQLEGYRVIAAYEPRCECGATMRKAKRVKGRRLSCPSFGAINSVVSGGRWD